MDYCNKDYQIGTYAPTTSSSGGTTTTGDFKNIDCVSIESDSITCTALTIDGEPWNNDVISTISQKVRNQSATSDPSTSFNGILKCDDINVASGEVSSYDITCDTLRPIGTNTEVSVYEPLSVSGSITSTDSMTVTNSSSLGDQVIAGFYQPLLNSSNDVKMQLGKSALSTDQCGELQFSHTSIPSTNNFASIHLLNRNTTSAVRVYPSYVNVLGELRGSTFTILPRTYSSVTTFSGTSDPTLITSISTSARRIVITITNCKITSPGLNPISIAPVTSGTTASTCTVTGSVWGNNAASTYSLTGNRIHMWNATTYPADESGKPRTYTYTLIITHLGTVGGFETYSIDGQGHDYQSQYYINMGGTIKADEAGKKISRIDVYRNNTQTFASGNASVVYY